MIAGDYSRLRQLSMLYSFDSRYSNFDNDIALVRMATAATLSSTVATICLTTDIIQNNREMITTGWGGVDADDTQSTFLKEVKNEFGAVATSKFSKL